jgi:asparagine synthase (glutamine-hydrolysing)
MFAFAIYDTEARTLFLARDRLGVKPLFMAHLADGSLAFASELKGLLAHPLLRREVDPLAIEDYLAWGYVPDHRSILKGVEKLPAGHYRLLRHDAPPARRSAGGTSRSPSAARLRARSRGRAAAPPARGGDQPDGRRRAARRVPFGRVDSSTVVALMAEASRAR